MDIQDEFDALLASTNQKKSEKTEAQATYDEIDVRFLASFATHLVPRVIDDDKEFEAVLLEDAILLLERVLREQLSPIRDDFLDDTEFEIYVHNEAAHQVHLRAANETAWMTKAKIIAGSFMYDQKNDPTFSEEEFMAKKELIAEFIACDGLDAHDPWVEYFNDVIPGPRLEIGTDDANEFMLKAFEEHVQVQADLAKNRIILQELFVLMNIDTESSTATSETANRIKAAAQLGMIAIWQRNPIEREAAMDEVARHLHMGTELMVKIKALLADRYPLNDVK